MAAKNSTPKIVVKQGVGNVLGGANRLVRIATEHSCFHVLYDKETRKIEVYIAASGELARVTSEENY